MSTRPTDPYEVLGISQDARISEIRLAYRKLVLKHHPDKFTHVAVKAEKAEMFLKIQKAYEILSDEVKREAYDDKGLPKNSEWKASEQRHEMGAYLRHQLKQQRRGSEEEANRRRQITFQYYRNEDDPRTRRVGQLNLKHQTRRQKTQVNRKQTTQQEGRVADEIQPGYDPQTNMIPHNDRDHRVGHNNPHGKSRLLRKFRPGILVVRGLFEELKTCAIPDTGAEYNIISGSFVDDLQLRNRIKQPRHRQPLRMANGQHIFTNGVLEASWRFGDDTSRSWKILFHILEDFVHDLILGNSFLMETQTMSYNQHRLDRMPRSINALSVLRVNLLGVPNQRLRGFVDDAETLAFLDSGSEPNLLSLEFIRAQGWEHKMNFQNRRLLQFADGSTTESEGSIRGSWHFVQKANRKKTNVLADFHILRGCVYDVIIGQDVLEETDAFLQYENDFVYTESTLSPAAMNLVWFASRKAKKAPTPPNPDHSINVELQRRALADQSIRRLPLGPERGEARREEEINRQLFDEQQETSRLRTPPLANLPNFRPTASLSTLPRTRAPAERFVAQEQESERQFNGGRVPGRRIGEAKAN